MKTLMQSIAIFSVIFVIGACSQAPKNSNIELPNGVKGTGDPVLDAGTKEALARMSTPVSSNMSQWEIHITNTIKDDSTDIILKEVSNYFFSENEYKQTIITVYTGKAKRESDNIQFTFDNDYVDKHAEEGTLSEVSTEGITFIGDQGTEVEIPTGYTKLYILNVKKASNWNHELFDGVENWEESDSLYTFYYIVKETEKELAMAIVNKDSSENTYRFDSSSDTFIYKKK